MGKKRRYITGLDGIRAIAVIMIRLSQKFFKSIVPSSSTSEISMPVIKYPDKTKNTVTPRKPLLNKASFK